MEKLIAVLLGLMIFIGWEAGRPFFAFSPGHWVRAGHNAPVGLTNALIANFLFAGLIVFIFSRIVTEPFGLLGIIAMPPWARFAATLLILDLWTYWWHRFNHTLPFLWRFHRAHHTDTEMGATTAYRFHPIEIIISSLLRIPLILLLCLSPEGLLWYEVILTLSILFHHANISIGRRADSRLRMVVVSPIMHKLHHSVEPAEFSSNYSSTLSIWDRLFNSWTATDQPERIKLGLNIYRDLRWQNYKGIMLTPFKRSGSRPKPFGKK